MEFENTQITIPLDSSFVNAFVYVIFDLGIAAAFGTLLCELHAILTSCRLRRGIRVTLRESPFRAITGGILRDGSCVWQILSLVQIFMFIALFAATLGINGRTSDVAIPIQRQYITYLPKDDPSIQNIRQSPPIFSSCVVSISSQLPYYPTAFDVAGNLSITNEMSFENQFGEAVHVDSNSSVCQDFEGIRPVLTVRKCGQSVHDCSNFNVSTGVQIDMIGNDGSENVLRSGHMKNYALWKKLEVPAGMLSSIEYSYLICSIPRARKVTGKHQIDYLCTAGHFDFEEQIYTFRIGRLNFSSEQREIVHDRQVDSVATFTPHSVEVELKYNVHQSRGMFFALMLRQNSEKQKVAAKEFLDSIVNRLTAAREVQGDILRRRIPRQVTDVQLYSLVIYVILIVVTVVLGFLNRNLRRRHGPNAEMGRINVDVTTYEGLMKQLHSAISHSDLKNSGFGVFCDEERQEYFLKLVSADQKLSLLPEDAVLQWY